MSHSLTPIDRKAVIQFNVRTLNLFTKYLVVNSNYYEHNVIISPLALTFGLELLYEASSGKTKDDLIKFFNEGWTETQLPGSSLVNIIKNLNGLDKHFIFSTNTNWNLNKSAESTSDQLKLILVSLFATITHEPLQKLENSVLNIGSKFNGTWATPFDKKLTVGAFKVINGAPKPCQFLTLKLEFRYFEDDHKQAVDIPYGSENRFFATILMPKEGTTASLDKLLHELKEGHLSKWTGFFSSQLGTLLLPQININSELSLRATFDGLGLGGILAPTADYSKGFKTPIKLDEILHRVSFQFNGDGIGETEADEEEDQPFIMKVDRPFLIVIREIISKAILFLGTVVTIN